MANTTLTASIIAKAAIPTLVNNCVMANQVYRGYESDFSKSVNGYEVGDTISVRRPEDYTVRDGRVMNLQDSVEGKFALTVDKFKGVDISFTSQELTLDIKTLTERKIKPAMVQLANQIDTDLQALYKDVSSWVGTPGQTINSNSDFGKGTVRLNQYAVPMDGRYATLSPDDEEGLISAQTTLLNNSLVGKAYTEGSLGRVRGVETFMSQNVPTHTVGAHGGTPVTNGASQATTYAATKDTDQGTLVTDGWTTSTAVLKAGDVFTIADVYAVNPVSKATLPFLKQFTVVSDVTSDGSGNATITYSPAAIASGAQQTVSADIGDGKAITVMGTASTGYAQNMIFNKNAFSLVSVPLVAPPGAYDVSRQSYKGTNIRVIPVYDGVNDVSKWRLDVLYGVKTIDQRQATRISGTA